MHRQRSAESGAPWRAAFSLGTVAVVLALAALGCGGGDESGSPTASGDRAASSGDRAASGDRFASDPQAAPSEELTSADAPRGDRLARRGEPGDAGAKQSRQRRAPAVDGWRAGSRMSGAPRKGNAEPNAKPNAESNAEPQSPAGSGSPTETGNEPATASEPPSNGTAAESQPGNAGG